MKKLILFLSIVFLSLSSLAQDKIFDFYAKDLNFCQKYATLIEDYKSPEVLAYYKVFNEVKIFYLYSTKYKRVVSIMIPYSTKKDMEILTDYFNTANKIKYNKKYWLIRNEKDDLLMEVFNDTKEKMFIIF